MLISDDHQFLNVEWRRTKQSSINRIDVVHVGCRSLVEPWVCLLQFPNCGQARKVSHFYSLPINGMELFASA